MLQRLIKAIATGVPTGVLGLGLSAFVVVSYATGDEAPKPPASMNSDTVKYIDTVVSQAKAEVTTSLHDEIVRSEGRLEERFNNDMADQFKKYFPAGPPHASQQTSDQQRPSHEIIIKKYYKVVHVHGDYYWCCCPPWW